MNIREIALSLDRDYILSLNGIIAFTTTTITAIVLYYLVKYLLYPLLLGLLTLGFMYICGFCLLTGVLLIWMFGLSIGAVTLIVLSLLGFCFAERIVEYIDDYEGWGSR